MQKNTYHVKTAKTEYFADQARLQEAIKNTVRVYIEIPRMCYQIRWIVKQTKDFPCNCAYFEAVVRSFAQCTNW